MRSLIISLVLLCEAATSLRAGQLEAGEYFLDSDPGPGNGTSFYSGNAGEWDGDIVLPPQLLAGLAPGLHDLGVRFRDADGEWGPLVVQRFEAADYSAPLLSAGEYFLNLEQIAGQGTALPTPQAMVYDDTVELPPAFLETLPDGLNTIVLRFQDSHGEWGPSQALTFVNPTDRSPGLDRIEWGLYQAGQLLASGTELVNATGSFDRSIATGAVNAVPWSALTAVVTVVDEEENASLRDYRSFFTALPGTTDGLSDAVDAPLLALSTPGAPSWYPQTTVASAGGDAACSGVVGHGQNSVMETTVNGSGTMNFTWQVSSQSNADWLEFWLDGVRQFRISGSMAWEQRTVTITGGGWHLLQWQYIKDNSGTAGSDAGWVDAVEWTPDGGSFAAWLSQHFTTEELNNPLISGPNATPHNDGVANLLKYAFNMNVGGPDVRTLTPGTGTSGLPSITQPTSGIFRFEFLRRIGSGLIYTPQKTGDISLPNSWAPLTDTPTIISIDATWERVIYEEPYDAATTPRCFGRVRVPLPP